jgi:zinc transport system ATP-binding protein
VRATTVTLGTGQLVALVGPNGAGKSTLLQCVLGLVEFTGTIRCHWRASGRIGYAPQALGVDPTLPITVAEFLALTRQRRPVCFGLTAPTRTKVAELLREVALSGGERQRVLLANALDPAPELLLLDEPTSGLDEAATQRFEERLLALRRARATTVLLVSHDSDQVRRVAERVTVLARGVRRTGTPAEVLAG